MYLAFHSATIATLASIREGSCRAWEQSSTLCFSCGRSFGISGRSLHYTAHPRHAHESIGAVRPVYRPWRHHAKDAPYRWKGAGDHRYHHAHCLVRPRLAHRRGHQLEAAIENLGEWLKRKTGSEGDNEFTNAFVSTSLTVCIGAMAIVGSIQDGLLGDWSTLALKGALDCIIVCTMTASLGRGCIFSALPVAVFQGTITLFAGALSPIMTTAALDSLSPRRLHAHLLRRRQPHPSSDLPHGQYAPPPSSSPSSTPSCSKSIYAAVSRTPV